jgi:hypothetical protein
MSAQATFQFSPFRHDVHAQLDALLNRRAKSLEFIEHRKRFYVIRDLHALPGGFSGDAPKEQETPITSLGTGEAQGPTGRDAP